MKKLKLSRTRKAKEGWNILRTKLVSKAVEEVPSVTVEEEEYCILSNIGEGGFSRVYTALNPAHQVVAVKVCNLVEEDGTINEHLRREAELLIRLNEARHIIQLYRFEKRENLLYMVMELGETDLRKMKESEGNKLRSNIRSYWSGAVYGVQELHRTNIVHMDLKPENFVLINNQIKIIDLGLAVEVPEGEDQIQVEKVHGTEPFIAPECFTSTLVQPEVPGEGVKLLTTLTRAVDIWSLGVVLLYMTSAQDLPSPTLPIKFILSQLIVDETEFPGLGHVMSSCLQLEPDKRPCASELQQMAL